MTHLKHRFLFTVVLLLSVVCANAEVLTGKCGTNLTYTLDTTTGVLKIEGSGDMDSYASTISPWFSSCSIIKQAKLSYGVTSVGSGAFYYCSGLTSIAIPSSVTSIGNYAF